MHYRTRLRIGEFSRLMQVTVKTLRHYERKGLLLPCEVDEWTGYRYYSLGQMQRLSEIRGMQRLGFSLDEIRELLDGPSHVPGIAMLEEKIRQTEEQLRQLSIRHCRLLEWRDSRKSILKMEQFSIQTLPEIIVASHREVIPDYAALGPLCYMKIGPAMQEAGCVCTQPGYCFTIDHNREYRLHDIDIEYCEQVEQMLPDTPFLQFRRIPAVPKALCLRHVGPYERFYESFTCAVRYMEEHGYRMAGHPRFSYIDGAWNQEDPEQWVSLIQIPIE
ncbi:MAG: MerR family transcriptional regulator [Bacteroidaceae bacterium]